MSVFGLKDGERKTLQKVSEETGMSLSAVKNYSYIAIERLRGTKDLETRLLKQIEDKGQLSEEEQKIINELKDIIFASNMIFMPDEKYKDEKAVIDSELFAEKIEALEKIRVEKIKKKHQEMSRVLNTRIEDLELSVRTYNCLLNAGITTLGRIRASKKDDLLKIENFGYTCLAEIRDKLKEYKLPEDEEFWEYYEEPKEKIVNDVDIDTIPIKKMKLSDGACHALERVGIETLGEIRNLSDDDFMKIKGLGPKKIAEIRAKLQEIKGDRSNNTDEKNIKPEPEPKEVDEKESDEIDELRGKKEELEKILVDLKQKAKDAETLLDGYNSLVDTDKTKVEESPDFKD